jgi:hypothetical protein
MFIEGVEYDEIELLIDGNFAVALIGPNIHDGTACFVEIEGVSNIDKYNASKVALNKLRKMINVPNMPFRYHPSHPFFSE